MSERVTEPYLNSLLQLGSLEDAAHKHARDVDLVRVQRARLHNLLHLSSGEFVSNRKSIASKQKHIHTHTHSYTHLSDGDLGSTGHGRVEIARRFAEDQVARLVRLPCLWREDEY